MVEVTVKQLADVVGVPVEKLLKQVQDAGLRHTTAEAVISDEEKQKLLDFLRISHGADGDAKITLKRKGALGFPFFVRISTCLFPDDRLNHHLT